MSGRVAHESVEVVTTLSTNDSRVGSLAVEVVTQNPAVTRVASLAIELVTGHPRSELSALTVPFSEEVLANRGST